VQIISASAISLNEAVEKQIFRADLRFRLDVMPVFLPPLRERREDICIIFDHYIRQEAARIGVTFKDVAGDVMEILEQYHWPGNVRELHNICIYMAAQLSLHDGHLNMDCVPDNILVNERTAGATFIERRKNPASPLATETKNQLNEDHINGKTLAEALLKFQGNKSAVARELGISRMTLWRKLKQHSLQN
jgi:transcriptional regulator with PAS, ATPase and Fis domain